MQLYTLGLNHNTAPLAIREQMVTLMRRRMLRNMSPGRVLSTILEANRRLSWSKRAAEP